MRPEKVLLVFMPFGNVDIPPLGVCLLKAILARQGIECDIEFFSLDFAARFLPAGREKALGYLGLLQAPRALAFHGEWLFARQLFEAVRGRPPVVRGGDDLACDAARAGEIDEVLSWVGEVQDRIPEFLDDCYDRVEWRNYAVVGFSSSFSQNLASLALAARIKARHPTVVTVVGGANADGAMGRRTVELFPQIDFAFHGEADLSFPLFVGNVLAGGDLTASPGCSGRETRRPPEAGPIVHDLDSLPDPDFDAFFERAEALGLASRFGRCLSVETSRGCWWGERSHCTFCGLNAKGMAFRSKTPARVLAELERLGERYGTRSFLTTDCILDRRYFRDLLPEIAARGWRLDLFFEIKANLRPGQAKLLRESGVTRVQPGIESLSTRILSLARKGTTLLENVQCLRACRANGLQPIWHHLAGFPGEKLQDYARLLEVLPALHHLEPPRGAGTVVVQRFSPYFDRPGEFGIESVRPFENYASIYPFGPEASFDLAYHFEHETRDPDAPERERFLRGPFAEAMREWRRRFHVHGSRLAAFEIGGRILVLDTRADPRIAWFIGRPESALLGALEEPSTIASALRRAALALEAAPADVRGPLASLLGPLFGPEGDDCLQRRAVEQVAQGGYDVRILAAGGSPEPSPAKDGLDAALDRLRSGRLVLEDGSRALALPIRSSFRELAARP